MSHATPDVSSCFGPESRAFLERLDPAIGRRDRDLIMASASRILAFHAPPEAKSVLALGYVQSGKTTSMSALCALAADAGFSVVVALLGTKHILVNQNLERLEEALGISSASNRAYRWVSGPQLGRQMTSRTLTDLLDPTRGRTILFPLLKNRQNMDRLTDLLSSVANMAFYKCLIIDDEADQASLNTRPAQPTPSSVYSALARLRGALPGHLYVAYTATPYAPLLLDPSDPLMPQGVEFLQPGAGYTGGREFLVEAADRVVRTIPSLDVTQRTTVAISSLPGSLISACGAYFAGAGILLHTHQATPPISMLVHSTQSNALQATYEHLLKRLVASLRGRLDRGDDPLGCRLGRAIASERARLEQFLPADGQILTDEEFWKVVHRAVSEVMIWLVNSRSALQKISWQVSPTHILVGGNKLDRGFTVEGLTVSYMNRRASDQIDTLEQRARAFGYRGDLLAFCQLFADARTLRTLRSIVDTEEDLRAQLRDWLAEGGSVPGWAKHVGLMLPAGTEPTRANVLAALVRFNEGAEWHPYRCPDISPDAVSHNASIVESLGLLTAPAKDFGRLSHRVIETNLRDVIELLGSRWRFGPSSPGWNAPAIMESLSRHPSPDSPCSVMLLSGVATNQPRDRAWDPILGFGNLFQGRDNIGTPPPVYPGDQAAGRSLKRNEDSVVLQIHHVRRRDFDDHNLYTLAIHLGDRQIVRRAT